MAAAPTHSEVAPAQRWYVYKDSDADENHGVWSGYIPDEARNMIQLNMTYTELGAPATNTCIRTDVALKNPWWCALAVTCKRGYWGEEKYAGAYDLSEAVRLVFKARGEKGGETIRVKVAVAGQKPYGDSARLPAATGWITLTKDWQIYELDLRGCDLQRVITPFCWVTNRNRNSGEKITFYFDNIYFIIKATGSER